MQVAQVNEEYYFLCLISHAFVYDKFANVFFQVMKKQKSKPVRLT